MKKNIYLAGAMLSLLFAPFAAPVAVFGIASISAGCKTSQKAVAFKSLSAVQATVKASLDGWADYVISERIKLGTIEDVNARNQALLSLTAKEDKVRSALSAYKTAAEVAHLTLLKGTDPAPADVVNSASAFVSSVATNK